MPDSKRSPNDPYYVLRKQGLTIKVGPLPIEQLLFEGLTREALVDYLTEQIEVGATRNGIVIPSRIFHVLQTSSEVEEVWRSSREVLDAARPDQV